MDKNSIRSPLLAQRKNLTPKQVRQKSGLICKKLLDLSIVKKSKKILFYLPVNNEVDTKFIFDTLADDTIDLYLPAFEGGNYLIRKFTSWEKLVAGPYGILQPTDGEGIDVEALDLAVIPGVAFDKKGVRLGYGKGVFDKLLSGSKCYKLGLAYSFQIVDKLPMEKHDLVMNEVISG